MKCLEITKLLWHDLYEKVLEQSPYRRNYGVYVLGCQLEDYCASIKLATNFDKCILDRDHLYLVTPDKTIYNIKEVMNG